MQLTELLDVVLYPLESKTLIQVCAVLLPEWNLRRVGEAEDCSKPVRNQMQVSDCVKLTVGSIVDSNDHDILVGC